jgi:microcystin-dependent protein
MEPFLGQLMLVPYNFAPQGWAFCNGQIMSIAQNSALFSLLGTTYGGNGQTTFALPDLRGRVAISAGQGPGLQNYSLGEVAGSESVTLISTQMPAHTHLVGASTGSAQATPDNAFPGSDTSTQIYDLAASTTMNPQMIQPAGGSQPHENRQPYLVLNYIIALQGIYPSRS